MAPEGTASAPADTDELDATKASECKHAGTRPGQKCGACDVVMVESPAGGAQSFAEIDQWNEARDARQNVWDLTWMFQDIMSNIFADESLTMTQKVSAIESALDEMKERVDDPGATKGLDLATASADELEAHRQDSHGQKQATKTEGGVKFKATDYADVPDREKPATWKLRLAEDRSGNFTVAQVGRAITALQPGGFRGNPVDLGQSRATVVAKIRRTISRTGGTDEQKDNLRERLKAVKERSGLGMTPPAGSFTFKEQDDGSVTWMGVYSNAARDNDKEILSTSAHEEFAGFCEKTGEFPELWLWHTPGTKFGETRQVAVIDGFAVAVGTIDEGKEAIARSLASEDGLEMSHGFSYDASDKSGDGVFSEYRSYEISVLPAGAAANPFTGWGLDPAEVVTMSKDMDPRRLAFFEKHIGVEETAAVIEGLGAMRKALEDEGVEFKDAAPVLISDLFDIEVSAPAGDGDGDGDGGAGEKQPDDPVAAALVALKGQLDTIGTRLDAQDTKLEALGQSKELNIRELFAGTGPLTVMPPSEDPENAADGRSADAKLMKAEGEGEDADIPPELRQHIAALKGA